MRTDLKDTEIGWPSPTAAWYGLIVLMCVSVVAILDRQILSLLVDPIRGSLGLNDIQIGVLQGPAFMFFYLLLGFPVGWLIDRTHRLRLIALGVAVWTVGTIGCGLATSYEGMFVARAIVGMGEAVAGPGSVSLLADYFSPKRRPLAISIHGTSAMFGIGLALLSGGLLLTLAKELDPIVLTGHPPLEGWRFVFLASAAPGLIVALMALTAREPSRRTDIVVQSDQAGFVAFLKRGKGWVASHFAAVGLIAIMSYAFMNWLPTFLIRGYDWEADHVGVLTGIQFLILGPAGILAGGVFVRLLQQRGRQDAAVRVLRVASVLLALALGSLALPWSRELILVPVSAAIFCISLLPITSILAIQQATPNELRGRLSAVYFITTNLIGYMLGPLVTAALTELVYGSTDQIGLSLATIGLGLGPFAVLLFTLALPRFEKLIKPPPANDPVRAETSLTP